MNRGPTKEAEILATKFGRWTPLYTIGHAGRFVKWLCKCDCGSLKLVRQGHLLTGGSRSCGCLAKEATGTRFRKHGLRHSAMYKIWSNMRDRCENPKNKEFKNYGGRGITVCDRWKTFEYFNADMGERPSPRHTIDRIDNDYGYMPGNCRWATRAQQARNTRRAVVVSIDGVTRPLKEWAELLGFNYKSAHQVLRRGQDIIKWIASHKKAAAPV